MIRSDTMDKALLDTDILSEILKGRDAQVTERARRYRSTFGRYTISAITVMEIVKGLHRQDREDGIQRFMAALAQVEVLGLDGRSAHLAGRIYADLERAGQPIGRADPMIAAIAMTHGLVLVTGNVKHYQRVQNQGHPLSIANWRW